MTYCLIDSIVLIHREIVRRVVSVLAFRLPKPSCKNTAGR